MKKTILALTIVASLGLAACGDSGKDVVVTSTYGDLTQEDFYKQVKEIAGTELLEQIMLEKILSEKYEVTDKEVDTEFDSLKEQYGEEFESALSQAGLTEDSLRANIRFNQLKTKALDDVEVTDEQIQAYYDKASKEIHARHILVADLETANAAIERINGGEDFADVAKELSTDTGSAENGGDLGFFTVGQMVPAFEDAAYALKIDEVSTPVQSDYGYHVIQVLEERELEDYGTLEEKKDEIVEAIKANTADWDTTAAALIKDANIEVKDKDLSNAFSSYK